MHQAVSPVDASAEGLVEQAQDATAPQGLLFHHANEGRPLATPWQIAALRAQALMQINLPDGFILDCACGSGIQLAAYAATLQRPVLGVELAPERAQASAVNVRSVASHTRGVSEAWFLKSRVVCGDGTDAKGVLSALGEDASNVAFLHLDPARPRNSRTHALEEMQPPLHRVLGQWAPYFEEPALLLDLSPRLTESQRGEVEALVDAVWPGIARTWEWTSRGRGRVDRLALWLGKVADPSAARRFVRVPASLADRPVVLSIENDPPTIEPKHRSIEFERRRSRAGNRKGGALAELQTRRIHRRPVGGNRSGAPARVGKIALRSRPVPATETARFLGPTTPPTARRPRGFSCAASTRRRADALRLPRFGRGNRSDLMGFHGSVARIPPSRS